METGSFEVAGSGVHIGARLGNGVHFLIHSLDGGHWHGRARRVNTDAGDALSVSAFDKPDHTEERVLVFPEERLDMADDHLLRNLIVTGLTTAAAAALIGLTVRYHHRHEGSVDAP